MWFVGLVLGAIAGAIGGVAGAFAGGLVGALLVWGIQQTTRAAADERLSALERALAELKTRLDALESRTASPPVDAPVIAAPPEPAPIAPTPAAEPALAASPESIHAATVTGERAEPASPPPQAAAVLPAKSSAALVITQIMGALAGGVLGLIEGFAGSVVGAFLGWFVVYAVQSHNRRVAADAARLAGRDDDRWISQPPQEAVEAPAPAPDARAPEPPAAPHAQWLRRLIGGNIVAKVGVLILFFGVGFLLKYAYDQGRLPVPVRVAGVAALALAMLYAGYRLSATRRLYGLILQGGGIGLLYLDVYFALRVYGLAGTGAAFSAFVALGVAATLLALRQDAKILAVLGLTGAFLAPVLAGSDSGDHVLLFSYYALLNAFILAVSWFKAWRPLNLVGFIFTFAAGVLWGANNYRPALFASVEPFVLLFFAMYLVIPILFAQRQPPQLKGWVDATLVFGTPLCVAFMQSGLVKDTQYGLAWSAAGGALIYAVLAALVIRREALRLLGETYCALAIVFGTLAIFFAFEQYVTFALWTLEGAAIVWVGVRQKRMLARWFGVLLQAAGAGYFLLHYESYAIADPWWNEFIVGCVLVAAAGLVTARLLHNHRQVLVQGAEANGIVMLVWAALWWALAGTHALYHAYEGAQLVVALLVFAALSATAAELAGARLAWDELRKLTAAHVPLLFILAALMTVAADGRTAFVRPFAQGGYWAWPLNFGVAFWIHARQVRDGIVAADNAAYRAAWVLAGLLATWDALWLLDAAQYGQAFAWGAGAIAAAAVRFRTREIANPAATPIAPAVLLWGLAFWFVAGVAWIERTYMVAWTGLALAFVAASCLLFEVAGARLAWPALRRVTMVLPPAMLIAFLAQLVRERHALSEYGWIAWPAAFAVVYFALRRQEADGVARFGKAQHVATLWLVVAVLTRALAWELRSAGFGGAWVTAAYGIVAIAVLALVAVRSAGSSWPLRAHYAATYRVLALGPVAAYVALWMLYANFTMPGATTPLPYVPILNPLDLAHLTAFWALARWSRTLDASDARARTDLKVGAALVFIWVNCVMLRTLHFWADIPYEWDAMWASVLVQAGFSLLWTGTALVVMLKATRAASRASWMVGAMLLGVVVTKLLLNDLSNTGTVARIVSFIGVGAGLLVIGYVAPVPPGDAEREAD